MEGMPIRVGPIGVSPSFTITNFGIDSNVFNDPVDPKSDFTLTATPKVLARLRAGRALFSGSLATGLVYYQEFDDERSVDYAGEGRADVELGWFRPYVLGSRTETSERLNIELDARAPRVQTHLAVGGRLLAGSRTGFVFAAKRSSVRFEEGSTFEGSDLSRTLSSDVRVFEGGLEYYATPLTTISIVASRQEDRFADAPERDADSILVMPSVRMEAPAIVQGSLAVGYRQFDGLNPALPDYSGVVAKATLTHAFGDATKVDLTASRDVQYSFEETEPYYLLSSVRVTVTRQIRESFDIRGSAGRDNLDYRSVGVDAADDSRVDHWAVVSAGVGYRYRPTLRFGVDVEYARRTSDLPDREYDRTRILGSFTYGF
jgi:hypothetical protein